MASTEQAVVITQYSPAGWQCSPAGVIREAPATLWVNGREWLTFLCTPTRLEALAVGFLWNEGILAGIDEVRDVRACEAGTHVDVWLSHSVEKPTQWRRTSGCTGGLTQAGEPIAPVIASTGAFLTPEKILSGMSALLEIQTLYRQVRGVHCSAISDGQQMRAHAEDIGRHNTLDKIAGILLLDRIHIPDGLIFTTGRISSEMLQKAARLNAAAVISRTSPTSLSIAMAEQLGLTLIGYARRDRFNVYAHPERLVEPVDAVPGWVTPAHPLPASQPAAPLPAC